MDWNKTIIFEEFRPIFLLFFIRHNHGINKPWRQFENWHCDLACKQPCEAEKNFQTGCQLFHPNMVDFSLYGEIQRRDFGCLLLGKMAAWIEPKLSERFAEFPSRFSPKPVKSLSFYYRKVEFWFWRFVSAALFKMIGGFFIYNHKGEVLISRVYRDDIG